MTDNVEVPQGVSCGGHNFASGKRDYWIGTAGWTIPKDQAAAFPIAGSHLERYAQQLQATEINSSFYRSHKPQTYSRWAASVPADFRFAVKLPRDITHTRKLVAIEEPLERFLNEIQCLGGKLGPLLVQLPPSLAYVEEVAIAFFEVLRERFEGDVACEPRHATWFSDSVSAALSRAHVVRVAADPACVPEAASPGGWTGFTYRRLHGSPRMYFSPYDLQELNRIAFEMQSPTPDDRASWCIFDNTAHGEATQNALQLASALNKARS
jgi:uncharacterized protein YecE (DUF72 family)